MKNIVLIGMPGAGKSTIGRLLARDLNKTFIDTDLLLQQREGKLLYEILESIEGLGFLEMEDSIIRSLHVMNSVIATGGSVVHNPLSIAHLRKTGVIVYLEISYDEMVKRIGKANRRGIVMLKFHDLLSLYRYRKPLYQRAADLIINITGKIYGEVVSTIRAELERYSTRG